MYATLTIEAIDYEQELLFTPEERYAQLTLWAQQVALNCDAQMSTVVAEFFLGNYLKGDQGNTPYIGENGNWWIGTTDTGTKAAGEDGANPTIGENKHWFINGVDTGIIAEGQDGYTPIKGVDYFDGLTPYIGMNGNWYIGTTDTGVKAAGTDGTNGIDGTDGVGISDIEKTGTILNVDEYTITFTDASTFLFYVTNGTDGRGIVSINKTSTVGVVDTYTITYSDTTTSTFEVTNADTSTLLKLDQTTPQTLTQSPKINDLVAGKMCYVDSNKQLKPIDVFWDNVKKQMLVGNYSGFSNSYGLSVLKSLIVQSTVSYSAGNGNINYTTIENYYNNVYTIKNANTGTESAMSFWTKNIEAVRIDPNQNVGIKTTAPKSALQVAGGIQCGDDTAAASADKVGTTRYRATANASYVEMCMQVSANSYSWVAIVTNTW